jgi:hypothetical protein
MLWEAARFIITHRSFSAEFPRSKKPETVKVGVPVGGDEGDGVVQFEPEVDLGLQPDQGLGVGDREVALVDRVLYVVHLARPVEDETADQH